MSRPAARTSRSRMPAPLALVSTLATALLFTGLTPVTAEAVVIDHLKFTTQPSGVKVGETMTDVVVEIQDAGNTTDSSDDTTVITLSIDNNPGTGQLLGTLEQTVVAGVATFSDLALSEIGNGYTLQASGAGLTANSSAFNVDKGELIITPEPGQSKVYGDVDPAIDYSYTGLASGDEGALSGALGRDGTEDVGTYDITIGDFDAGTNYNVTLNAETFEITPAALQVTPDPLQAKTYGDVDPAEYTYTTSGLTNGDSSDVITGALTRVGGEDVGTYDIQIGDLSAGGNYDVTLDPEVFTIGEAVLTITPDAGQAKTYGDDDPAEYTYTYDGLTNGDTAAIFSGALDRDPGSNAGDYDITIGDFAATSNYTIALDPEVFTINKAELMVTPDADQTKVYGEEDPDVTWSYEGLVEGDGEEVFSGALAFDGSDAGEYDITIGDLSAGNNYDITLAEEVFTITPKPVTVTPTVGQWKYYDDEDPDLQYTVDALEEGDALEGALGRADARLGETAGDDTGETVGWYAYTLGTLSNDNYTLTLDATSDFQIRKPAVREVVFESLYSDAAKAHNDWRVKFNTYNALRGGNSIMVSMPLGFNMAKARVIGSKGFTGCKFETTGVGTLAVVTLVKKPKADSCSTVFDTQLSIRLRAVKNGPEAVYGAGEFSVSTSMNRKAGSPEEGMAITAATGVTEVALTEVGERDDAGNGDMRVTFTTGEKGRLLGGDSVVVKLGAPFADIALNYFTDVKIVTPKETGCTARLVPVSMADGVAPWKGRIVLKGADCLIKADTTVKLRFSTLEVPEDVEWLPSRNPNFWVNTATDAARVGLPTEA